MLADGVVVLLALGKMALFLGPPTALVFYLTWRAERTRG